MKKYRKKVGKFASNHLFDKFRGSGRFVKELKTPLRTNFGAVLIAEYTQNDYQEHSDEADIRIYFTLNSQFPHFQN